MMDTFPWKEMNDDLRQYILRYLTVKELMPVERVNKKMKQDVLGALGTVHKLAIFDFSKPGLEVVDWIKNAKRDFPAIKMKFRFVAGVKVKQGADNIIHFGDEVWQSECVN